MIHKLVNITWPEIYYKTIPIIDPWTIHSLLPVCSGIIDFILGPSGHPTSQDPAVQNSTRADRTWRNHQVPGVEQLWLMSFLKVDQTLMLRRGNWSKGILNYLMRGSLSERFLFLSSFILLDHMADLYITKELPGWSASFKTPCWSIDTLHVWVQVLVWEWATVGPCFTLCTATHCGIFLKYCVIKISGLSILEHLWVFSPQWLCN